MNSTFSIPNTAGITRLRIGVTGCDGKYAEMTFVAETPSAPLVAVDETPALSAPTEEELEAQYQAELRRRQQDLGRVAEEGGEICQDDYEWATGTGIYANGETPIGDEMFGGE